MDVVRGFEVLEHSAAEQRVSLQVTSATTARVKTPDSDRRARVRALDAPPGPARVRRELDRLDDADADALLYVVPRLTESLRATALADARVIVVAVEHGDVILDRTERHAERPPEPTQAPRGRKPWGRFALVRALLRTATPRTQSEFASETGFSQQAIALALPALESLGVERSRDGWVGTDAESLWDEFLRAYPGPGGVRRRWSSVASLEIQQHRVHAAAEAVGLRVLLSGDAAADVQAPMRRPLVAVAYTTADLDLATRFAPAPSGEETVSVVVPADPTIMVTARAWATGDSPTVTDPLITAWEVAHSRGPDRVDAVEALRRLVVADRETR